jgi:hypothetical protein
VVLLRAQRSGCASRSALPGCARARPQQECDGLVLRTGVGAHRSRGRRTAVRLALACTLCMLISSCASFRPEPINLRVSARRFAARTVHSRRLTRYLVALGLPPENSWGFRRLTYVAVFERPQLTIANARYRAALGSLRLAEQIDNPKIGIRTAYNASQLLPTPWSVGPIFSFLIQKGACSLPDFEPASFKPPPEPLIELIAFRNFANQLYNAQDLAVKLLVCYI